MYGKIQFRVHTFYRGFSLNFAWWWGWWSCILITCVVLSQPPYDLCQPLQSNWCLWVALPILIKRMARWPRWTWGSMVKKVVQQRCKVLKGMICGIYFHGLRYGIFYWRYKSSDTK
jgi:hypothetical protein